MVSKISASEVEHVANLARLNLTDESKKVITEQLNTILEYAAKLDELDTDDVDPTFYVLPAGNVLREDVSEKSMDREEVLSNAPEKEDGAFKVPKVF